MPQPTCTYTEQWRPVVGYEGLYDVSNHGRVRSLDRIIPYVDGRDRPIKGAVLRQGTSKAGHRSVNLSRSRRTDTLWVHRLVALAFIGPDRPGTEVRHLDGDPANNHVSNLQWGTRRQNMLDRRGHGAHHEVNKTHCPRGHLLDHPNLVAYSWKKHGYRQCLACARARAHFQHYPNAGTMQHVSDMKYAAIIAGTPTT